MRIRFRVWIRLGALCVPAGILAAACSVDERTFVCADDAQCADADDCTKDVCRADGRCEHLPVLGALGGACGAQDPPECSGGSCVVCPLDSTPGDCKGVVCDESGRPLSVNDDSDVPADDGVDCTEDVCHDGVPEHPMSAAGTPCGQGRVCNAHGACVPCVDGLGCDAAKGEWCDKETKCVSCADKAQDPSLQCVGPHCPACPGEPCGGGAVCANGLSCLGGRCCSTPCSGDCMSCDSARTGEPDGECAPLRAGTKSTCGDGALCDGLGACRKVLGRPCNADAECLTNACFDPAGGTNKSCGTCSPGSYVCPSQFGGLQQSCREGACRKENNQPCALDIECASYLCAEGICKSCLNDDVCASEQCNNGGNCVYQQGMPCSSGPACASGYCTADSYPEQLTCK